MPAPPDLAAFCEMVRRNLGALGVAAVWEPDDPCPAGTVLCPLPGGGFLMVSFDAPVPDHAATLERIETLVSSFGSLLESLMRANARPSASAGTSLHDQVVALAEKASALDVVIIDAHSPVVWDSLDGSFVMAEDAAEAEVPNNVRLIDEPAGRPRRLPPDLVARARMLGVQISGSLVMDPRLAGLVPAAIESEHGLVPLYVAGSRLRIAMCDPSDLVAIREVALATGMDVEPVLSDKRLIDLALRWKGRRVAHAVELAGTPELADAVRTRWQRHFASRMAIELVRRRPEMPTLHKGGHLVFGANTERFGFIARSFAGIYVLILVFPGPYDEIKAKHAIARTLPAIESLVLALPPTDPSPSDGAAMAGRMRGPRR